MPHADTLFSLLYAMSLDKTGPIGHLWARGSNPNPDPSSVPQPLSRQSLAHEPDWAIMSRVVRPSPALVRAAAFGIAAATFMAVPLLAEILPVKHAPAKTVQSAPPQTPPSQTPPSQTPPSQTPPSQTPTSQTDPGKGEAQADKREAVGKTEPAKHDAKKPEGDGDAGKSEALKRDPGKPDPGAVRPEEAGETGHPHLGAAGRGECQWLGQRVVGLLWRDDLDTAFRHLELYDRFGCPGEHLQLSFRCITRQGDIQKNPKLLEPKEGKEQKEPSEQKEQRLFDMFVEACWTDPATPAPQPAVEKPAPK
jgi:hypothetical protein